MPDISSAYKISVELDSSFVVKLAHSNNGWL